MLSAVPGGLKRDPNHLQALEVKEDQKMLPCSRRPGLVLEGLLAIFLLGCEADQVVADDIDPSVQDLAPLADGADMMPDLPPADAAFPDARLPDATPPDAAADAQQVDMSPGTERCALPMPTVRSAEVVWPEFGSLEESQGIYPYAVLALEAEVPVLDVRCCHVLVHYHWDVLRNGEAFPYSLIGAFFNPNTPEEGGEPNGPEASEAFLYLDYPGSTFDITLEVRRYTYCPEREEEVGRSASFQFTTAPLD